MEAVMATDASVNTGALPVCEEHNRWVSQIQAKLHRWAAADPGRRFDDLFNLVHNPATLAVAWDRVARNRVLNVPAGDDDRGGDRQRGC
jgi:RNA-directed DNA polymerase